MTYAESNYQGSAIGTNNQAAFTFSYLDVSEIRVDITVGSTKTTYSTSSNPAGFTLVSPNQYVTLSSHPADSTAIRIYRITDLDSTQATFVAGSAISANDLNNNYTQILQASQETRLEASTATTTANTAKTTADGAVTTANSASSTATTASTNASSAVTTANTASTNASSAVTTANSAVSTANAASATATAAQNAVANALFYTPVANVSSIPGSPSNEDRIEISDSTGIQSFSPLNGLPSGFTGSSDLIVRLQYDASNSRWDWKQYFADDPENRYLPFSGGTLTGALTLSGAPSSNLHAATKAYVDSEVSGLVDSAPATLDTLNELAAALGDDANFSTTVTNSIATKLPLAGGTMTGAIAMGTSKITGVGDPTAAQDVATKAYVDTNFQGADADTAKTDVAQTYSKAQRGAITTLTDGATVTPDFAASNNYTLTLGGNRTIANPTNLTAGQSGSIFLVQDGTGSRTVSWGSYWDWAAGTAPTLTTTANAVDRIDYVVRTTGSIHAVATLAYS